MKLFKGQSGITLIEIIVVVSIIALLIVVVALPLITFRKTQALENATNTTIAILNEARTRTLAAVGGTSYGVRIESTQVILFTGTSYSSGSSTNEITPLDSPATASASLSGGGSEIKFDRLSGTTSQSGTITLSISGGSSHTVTVSATGAVVRN
jgi:prepilin-type N-terminal cleavage/methylation domain-containing protein